MNSAFPTKKILEENLSEYLKKGRQKSNLSLTRLAEELAVSEKYLLALEEGQLRILPPTVYSLGLIRNYARILNLDEEKAVYLFKKNSKNKKTVPSTKPVIYQNLIEKCLTYRNFIFSLITVLIFLLGFYLIKTLYPLFTLPFFELKNQEVCGSVVNSVNVDLIGLIKGEERIWINGEEINPDKDGSFFASVFLKNGENHIKFKIKNKFGREREEECLIKKI